MQRIVVLILALLSSACSTTLYVARTEVPDGDKQCEVQTYWYKTSSVFGSKADQSLPVRMGGRTPVTYNKNPQGIVYMGESKTDKWVGLEPAPAGERFVCGVVEGINDLLEFVGTELRVSMHCELKRSPLTKTPGYLPARTSPYVLQVTSEKEFFWLGGQQDAPSPPTCRP